MWGTGSISRLKQFASCWEMTLRHYGMCWMPPGVHRARFGGTGSLLFHTHSSFLALFLVTCIHLLRHSVSSVTQFYLTLCDPMNCSTPGLPVYHQLLESTQIHVHQVNDAIQPSHPLSSPSPPALSLSQHQGLFKWVSSSHQEAKVLEFQL